MQEAWWRDFISKRPDCVGIETSLLLNPKGLSVAFSVTSQAFLNRSDVHCVLMRFPDVLTVWEASGHVQQFVDPLSECAQCRKRVRADKAVMSAAAALSDAQYEKLGLSPRSSFASCDLNVCTTAWIYGTEHKLYKNVILCILRCVIFPCLPRRGSPEP